MSRLAEFREIDQKLAALLAELESLKNDPDLLRKVTFENKARAILSEYIDGLPDPINTLEPRAKSANDDPAADDEKAHGKFPGIDKLPTVSWDLPGETFS